MLFLVKILIELPIKPGGWYHYCNCRRKPRVQSLPANHTEQTHFSCDTQPGKSNNMSAYPFVAAPTPNFLVKHQPFHLNDEKNQTNKQIII